MTSEPRVNCQRGGKGLVRVGLSDKGVGTSALSLSLFSSRSFAISFFLTLALSLSLCFSYPSSLFYLSLSFSCNLLSRVTARARPLFFPSFRIPNFIFIGRRFRARARARAFCRADQPKQWFASRRIKSKAN